MTDKTDDDGGPAFPVPIASLASGDTVPAFDWGMSLRDFFAGQVAAGMAAFSGTAGVSYGPHDIAGRAFEVADAMLAAKARPVLTGGTEE